MSICKNQCLKYERGSKHRIYQTGGGYCRSCDYYFKGWFIRCPCCKSRVRHVSRMSLPKIENC